MKLKQKVDSIINSFLVIIGIIIIILSVLKYNDVKIVFISVMIAYAIINLIQFLLTKKSNDYEYACLPHGFRYLGNYCHSTGDSAHFRRQEDS